jgi:hypothetical protein
MVLQAQMEALCALVAPILYLFSLPVIGWRLPVVAGDAQAARKRFS